LRDFYLPFRAIQKAFPGLNVFASADEVIFLKSDTFSIMTGGGKGEHGAAIVLENSNGKETAAKK